jgi:hypothetical protein
MVTRVVFWQGDFTVVAAVQRDRKCLKASKAEKRARSPILRKGPLPAVVNPEVLS